MPSAYSATDLLRIFKDVYKSIDVRWVAARHNDKWLLIALSVHVRADNGESTSQRFRTEVDQLSEMELSAIRISQKVFPIGEIDAIAEMILAGKLILDGIEYAPLACPNFLTQFGIIQSEEPYGETQDWPLLKCAMSLHNDHTAVQAFATDSQFIRATEFANYKTADAAVSHLLGIDFTLSNVGGFWLSLDVPLRLLPHTIAQKGDGQVLGVRVETHPALNNVSCAARITTAMSDRAEKALPVTKLNRLAGDVDIAHWAGELPLTLRRDDLLEVDILYQTAGRVISRRDWGHTLLPIELANPLFTAVTMFCTSDQILSFLTKPETADPGKRVKNDHRGSHFEITIQWLLSVLGFQAIWLHGYEISREGKVEVGAVDCLAYSESERLLLLVNCSLGAPDPAELNQHAAFCAKVSKRFSAISNVKVLAVLATATQAPEGRRQDSSVVILYKDDLLRLHKVAESGQNLVFSTFINPVFSGQWHA